MKSESRFPIFRILFLAAGFLVLFIVVFFSLSWAVTRHRDWLERAVGGRMTEHLWRVCRDLAQRALPGDSDGDDVCDGLELFYQTDPRNPLSHPDVSVEPDHPMVGDCIWRKEVILFCGERTRVRWVEIVEGQRVRFTRKNVMLSADEPALLTAGGTGKPTKGPLQVAVSPDGSVEFDLGAEQPIDISIRVTLTLAGSGAWTHELPWEVAGWPLPSVEAYVCRDIPSLNRYDGNGSSLAAEMRRIEQGKKGGDKEPRRAEETAVTVEWKKANEPVAHYVIESRGRLLGGLHVRAFGNADLGVEGPGGRSPSTEWKRIYLFQGDTTGLPLDVEGVVDEHGVIGEYRVIPTKPMPPSE